ncbi:MAG: prenyltransferase [Gammaproteobacteria bacterium]|nr:MAG: prenyltransferase [Gammaproteobacteria bacterium]
MISIAMWGKALSGMPKVDEQTWQSLDLFAKWLVATRAAVLIMTLTSAALAGLFAYKVNQFDFTLWLFVTLGLCLAHATNNLLNDLTDHLKGVDKGNYFRSQYGVQPIESGLMSVRQNIAYAAVTGGLALLCGIYLWSVRGNDVILLTAIGAFFVLFYTWPLKYIGLGEPAVLLVWGPLMIGGGYFVIAGDINFPVLLAATTYALAPTAVLFGKHIDKLDADKAKGIRTLPVILGHKRSRQCVMGLFALQYLLILVLVSSGYFHPVVLLTFLALPSLIRMYPYYKEPPPKEPPPELEQVWPLYYVAGAFWYTRRFGFIFTLMLIIDAFL